jgi:hypothetical protein
VHAATLLKNLSHCTVNGNVISSPMAHQAWFVDPVEEGQLLGTGELVQPELAS